MPRFKLICDHSCDLDTHVVTHEFSADYLPEVLMNLDMFLRGAGYIFDGQVDIIEAQPIGAGTNFESGGAGVQHNQHFYDTERNR